MAVLQFRVEQLKENKTANGAPMTQGLNHLSGYPLGRLRIVADRL